MKNIPNDPYRDWSFPERRDAFRSDDYDVRQAAHQAQEDSDSGDRAYENWRNGGDFVDPEPDNRFS